MYELTEYQLERLGNLFIEVIKAKLLDQIYPYGNPEVKGLGNKYASGQLYNSLSAKVIPIPNNEGFQLEISYMDYFKYVNLGRKPKAGLVPIPALLEWIKVRGLKGRNKRGRFIPNLSLAFAIRRNIYKYGIRASNIYDKAYDSFEDLLVNPPPEFQDEFNALYEAIGQDLENLFEQRIINELQSAVR